MSATFELNAEVRTATGKAEMRRMRRHHDLIPAIVYGAGKDPQSVTLTQKDMMMAMKNEAIYSHILTLNVGKTKEKVVLKALQRHPYKPMLMHVDFLRIDAKAKITMTVPLHYLNEEDAPGFKEGGVVSHLATEIDIKCLPGALPEFLEVDASGVEMDSSLHLSDVKLPKGVELLAELTEDNNQPIMSIHKPRAVKEDAEEETVEGDSAEADKDDADKAAE